MNRDHLIAAGNDLGADLQRAARLAALGIEVRSVQLTAEAKLLREWHAKGGNRAMRRQAAKAKR